MGRSVTLRKTVARAREVRAVRDGQLDPRFWVLVKTYTGQEWTAAEALRKVGFEVYLPLRLVRHRNGLSGRAALYPRYLFVRATLEVERWQVIFTTKGVAMVMGNGGRPVGFRLRDQEVRQHPGRGGQRAGQRSRHPDRRARQDLQ